MAERSIKNYFQNHRREFIENEDYYILSGDELKRLKIERGLHAYAPKSIGFTQLGVKKLAYGINTKTTRRAYTKLRRDYFK